MNGNFEGFPPQRLGHPSGMHDEATIKTRKPGPARGVHPQVRASLAALLLLSQEAAALAVAPRAERAPAVASAHFVEGHRGHGGPHRLGKRVADDEGWGKEDPCGANSILQDEDGFGYSS